MKPIRELAGGVAVAVLLVLAASARADGPRLKPLQNAVWQEECSACHIPYHPGLLPASSWNAVVDSLGQHFGTDASLAPAETAALKAFLAGNAGSGKYGRDANGRDGRPLQRISQMPWFVHEHGEELPASVWKRKEVGSAANCGACHGGAAQGRFTERDIKVPGGGR